MFLIQNAFHHLLTDYDMLSKLGVLLGSAIHTAEKLHLSNYYYWILIHISYTADLCIDKNGKLSFNVNVDQATHI